MARRHPSPFAFTLVELLVVMLIIALLISIAIPAFDAIYQRSQATVSQQNLRQWGIAAASFAGDENGRYPKEGLWSAAISGLGGVGGPTGPAAMSANMDDPEWWANALGPYIDEPAYGELARLAAKMDPDALDTVDLPVPPMRSIYIDPTAKLPKTPELANLSVGAEIPFETADQRRYFFTYAWNSRLDDTFRQQQEEQFADPDDVGALDAIIEKRVPTSRLGNAGATVLMFEMRTTRLELEGPTIDPEDEDPHPGDPYFLYRLDQHKSDWSRFAARHGDGAHVLFADGHISRFLNNYAITPVEQDVFGSADEPGGSNFNKQDLIWDPMGPATEGE